MASPRGINEMLNKVSHPGVSPSRLPQHVQVQQIQDLMQNSIEQINTFNQNFMVQQMKLKQQEATIAELQA